jgi:hypothetical protein
MGILDSIKSKVFNRGGKTEDISDIRSHVIGDSFQNTNQFNNQSFQNENLDSGPFQLQNDQSRNNFPQDRSPPPERAMFSRDTAQEFQANPFPQNQQNYGRFQEEPLRFENDLASPSTQMPEPTRNSGDYEVRDRLNMIEIQLSAIRSL